VHQRDAAHAQRVAQPAAVVDRSHQVEEHLLALAAHHGVDPGRFLQHLLVHEGAMDAAEHGDHVRVQVLGQLEQALGLVDGRCDGRAADHIGFQRHQPLAHLLIAEVVRHRVDEGHVVVTAGLQIAGQVGHPRGRPVARDLSTAGVVVGVDQHESHRHVLHQTSVNLS